MTIKCKERIFDHLAQLIQRKHAHASSGRKLQKREGRVDVFVNARIEKTNHIYFYRAAFFGF